MMTEWWELRVTEQKGRMQITSTMVFPTQARAVEAAQALDKPWTLVYCEARAVEE